MGVERRISGEKAEKMRNFLIRTALYIIIKVLGGVWGGSADHDFFCEAGQGLTVSGVYMYMAPSAPNPAKSRWGNHYGIKVL